MKRPDGWQSVTRFCRLVGIKDNRRLTPKPEVNVCVRKDKSESPFTSPRHLLQDEGELTFHSVCV